VSRLGEQREKEREREVHDTSPGMTLPATPRQRNFSSAQLILERYLGLRHLTQQVEQEGA
jgi:hypothetical protein